ncbi:hypothetical protein [Microbacterium forte]|uniref:hypothetical protein n=1 Tax=Microbacterium forte TaxID=2982533 RepID=UPI002893568F|nr:hypothetical protein [Microbacterium sp. A(2022)]
MSDVREVSDYHEWMAGTVAGAGERLDGALRELFEPFAKALSAALDAGLLQLEARFSDRERTEAPRPPSPSPQVTPEKRKRARP